MKIGVFQDVHANLPAYKQAIQVFRERRCERIVHVGDLIGIGPYPREVMELALSDDKLTLVMGNHDYWYGFGLPDPLPKWMSEEEVLHQKWTHHQIGNDYKELVRNWKFVEKWDISKGKSVRFQHYGYDKNMHWFKPFVKLPNRDNMDALFSDVGSEILFYGHHHDASDITGKSRYVNLGSAGCYSKAEVRLGILSVENDEWTLEKLSIPYDDNGFMEEYDKREVPAKDFIRSNFISRS